jgi:CheY-like chemotaxis protein
MKIVASNNSFVYDELGGEGFRFVNAEPIIVSSGTEALAAAKEHKPDLLVLDADMPELDGYEVCEAVKGDDELRLVRVILILQGSISSKQLNKLANCGCDDVVVFRIPGDTLYHHAARLLGLPDPSLAEPVTLQVSIGGGAASDMTAHATHLSIAGVDLLTAKPLTVGAAISLNLRRDFSRDGVELSGKVVSSSVDKISQSPIARVVFDDLEVRQRAQLADLALWDAKTLPAGVRITLRGSFDEGTDFSRIPTENIDNIIFDLSGIRLINSWGARQWIMFLRSLPEDLEFCFVNAAPVFIKHCNMVSDMLGRGAVLSFAAPYECQSCGNENDRILQVSSISPAVMHEPPQFRCPMCAGVEEFDDVPSRYFAFLEMA